MPGTFAYTPPLGTVPGSGSQTLTAVTFTPTDTTNYTMATASVILNVGYAPAILVQPTSQTAAAGQTATFTVAAAGAATFIYQWRVNGTPISEALETSYTTLAAQAQDSGSMSERGRSQRGGQPD